MRMLAPARVSASSAPAAAPPAPAMTMTAPDGDTPRSPSAAIKPAPSVFSARTPPRWNSSVFAAADTRTSGPRRWASRAAASLCGMVTFR